MRWLTFGPLILRGSKLCEGETLLTKSQRSSNRQIRSRRWVASVLLINGDMKTVEVSYSVLFSDFYFLDHLVVWNCLNLCVFVCDSFSFIVP